MTLKYSKLQGRYGIEISITEGPAAAGETTVDETDDGCVIDAASITNIMTFSAAKHAVLKLWPKGSDGELIKASPTGGPAPSATDAPISITAWGGETSAVPQPIEMPYGFKWSVQTVGATNPASTDVNGHLSYAVVKKSVDASGVPTT